MDSDWLQVLTSGRSSSIALSCYSDDGQRSKNLRKRCRSDRPRSRETLKTAYEAGRTAISGGGPAWSV